MAADSWSIFQTRSRKEGRSLRTPKRKESKERDKRGILPAPDNSCTEPGNPENGKWQTAVPKDSPTKLQSLPNQTIFLAAPRQEILLYQRIFQASYNIGKETGKKSMSIWLCRFFGNMPKKAPEFPGKIKKQ